MVRIQVALRRIQAIFAQRRLLVVVDFVAIIHLVRIEHTRSLDRVRFIDAVERSLLVLVGFSPRNGFGPIEVRAHRVAVAVLCNLIRFVATVRRIGQTLADNGIAHPIDKLFIHRVGDFRLIHPEAIDGDVARGDVSAPKRVVLFYARLQIASFYFKHAVGRRLSIGCALHAGHFTAATHRAAPAEAGREHQTKRKQTTNDKILITTHIFHAQNSRIFYRKRTLL